MPGSRAVRAAAVVSAVVIAAILWYLGSPLFVRTSANEPIPAAAASTAATTATTPPLGATPATQTDSGPTIIARGELQFVDSLHNGKGSVMLLAIGGGQRVLRFENVAITNAPDVHVYLSRETGGKWTDSTSLYLGALKATNGSFNYDIPASAEVKAYRSVVVWCRAFAVLVTWADLTFG